MPLLMILLFPVAEIYLIFKLSEAFSFLDVLFMMLTTGVLGLLIMFMQGRSVVLAVQKSFAVGEVPGNQILHRGLVFVGGFFLFLPGVLTDVIGICLILPGIRHLIVLYVRIILARGMARGSIKVFANSATGFGAMGGFSGFNKPTERDAKVIDIEVLETSSKRIE